MGIGRCGGGRYGGGHYKYTAEDCYTAEDGTAELYRKGWTLRRSHQNTATHITMELDATAEIRRNSCSLIMFLSPLLCRQI